MNIAINISYLAVNIVFLAAYLTNFILVLKRDMKAKKALRTSPCEIDATVKDIQSNGKRIFLLVDFMSPVSYTAFTHQYEFVPGEINPEDYYKGQKVTLIYNDVKDEKKVLNFPLLLKGSKIKLDKGPLFTNILMTLVAVYGTVNHLVQCFLNNAFVNNEVTIVTLYGNYFYPFIILLLYTVLITYLVDSLINAPKGDNQSYLKLYGIRSKARVTTFKFVGTKNQKGFRESAMQIEYYTSTGEKINTKISSYLYSETQEEYVDIIYDAKNPKNVVYLRA